MENNIALKAEDLVFSYQKKTEAIKDVSLNLEKGKIHVILGPNGAGKTTFLRIASTEFLPQKGTMKILNHDTKKNREAIVRKIGVMPQKITLYKQLTAWEHVYYFTLLKGLDKADSKKETERVLKLLDLYERRNDELNSFSGGMINAVNLAQAIAGYSELLFLDEPTVGFDPHRRRIVWDYIKNSIKDKTVILTTQYLDEAQSLADNIIIFSHGKVIHQGDIQSVINKLGYEIKIEIPFTDSNREIVKQMEKHFHTVQNDKIIIWAHNGNEILKHLVESKIDMTSVNILRPMLEEAYLNIIDSNFTFHQRD